jgi:hypothetical protein
MRHPLSPNASRSSPASSTIEATDRVDGPRNRVTIGAVGLLTACGQGGAAVALAKGDQCRLACGSESLNKCGRSRARDQGKCPSAASSRCDGRGLIIDDVLCCKRARTPDRSGGRDPVWGLSLPPNRLHAERRGPCLGTEVPAFVVSTGDTAALASAVTEVNALRASTTAWPFLARRWERPGLVNASPSLPSSILGMNGQGPMATTERTVDER